MRKQSKNTEGQRMIKSPKKSGRINKQKAKKTIKKIAEKKQKNTSDKKRTLKAPKKSGTVSKTKIKKAVKKITEKRRKGKTETKSTNILNVGKLMRGEAYIESSKKKIRFKISQKAVHEEISFIKARIEADVFGICKRIHDENIARKRRFDARQKLLPKEESKVFQPRTTILEKDILIENGFVKTDLSKVEEEL